MSQQIFRGIILSSCISSPQWKGESYDMWHDVTKNTEKIFLEEIKSLSDEFKV